jgi:hypothetical protein
MNKSKSLIVTILFAVMLAAIDMGLLKIWIPGFGIITGALALFGFWKLAEVFAGWLQGAGDDIDPLELPSLKQEEEVNLGDVDFSTAYDAIRAEVMEGRADE